MNIFFLDKCSQKSAQALHNIHLRKMIVETGQLLSSVHAVYPGQNPPKVLYKISKSQANHPCAQWARANYANYVDLLGYMHDLLVEYEYRFEKSHKSQLLWDSLKTGNDPDLKKFKNVTQIPLCMPDKYKSNDPIQSYRDYYINEKTTDKNGKWMMYYTKREPPTWLPKELREKCYV